MSCIRLGLSTVSVASEDERRRIRAEWSEAFARDTATYEAEYAEYLRLAVRLGEPAVALPAWPSPPDGIDVASIERWTHACRRAREPLARLLYAYRQRVEELMAEQRSVMTERSVEAELARLERLLTDDAGTDVSSGARQDARLEALIDGVRRNRERLLVDADAATQARAEDLARAVIDAAERKDHGAARDRLDELRFLVQKSNERLLRRPGELHRARLLRSQLAGLPVVEPDWLAHLEAVIADTAAPDPDLFARIGRRVEAERLGEALVRIGYAVPDGFADALSGRPDVGAAALTTVVRAGAPGIDDGVRFLRTADGTIAAEVVRDVSATPDPDGDRRIEEAWLAEDLPRLLEALASLGVEADISRRDPAGSHPLERVSGVRPLDAVTRAAQQAAQRTRRPPAMELRR